MTIYRSDTINCSKCAWRKGDHCMMPYNDTVELVHYKTPDTGAVYNNSEHKEAYVRTPLRIHDPAAWHCQDFKEHR